MKCTLDAFRYLCAYHQVFPEFLELLFSFGNTIDRQAELQRPQGYQEYWPKHVASKFETPELGRSGWEIRSCGKLSAMEKSQSDPKIEWTMRQMAFYHSFDLLNGRCFFITVKANDRIYKEVTSSNNGAVENTLPASFAASLKTQLIGFNWCTSGWSSHISTLELQIRKITAKMTGFPCSVQQASRMIRPWLERTRSPGRNLLPPTLNARIRDSSHRPWAEASGLFSHAVPRTKGQLRRLGRYRAQLMQATMAKVPGSWAARGAGAPGPDLERFEMLKEFP